MVRLTIWQDPVRKPYTRNLGGPGMPSFDRSDLPEADLEFVVIADTHHLVDPGMYKAKGDSVTPEIVREWSDRGDWALALAKATETALVFHVGDLAQEYPGSRFFDTGRRAAVTQFEESGLEVNFAAGNMDIGDKPDPTVPAGWVEPGFLKRWDEDFGKSFFSRTAGDSHFIVLNSQIMTPPFRKRSNNASGWRPTCRPRLVPDLHVHASSPLPGRRGRTGAGQLRRARQPGPGLAARPVQTLRRRGPVSGHTHFQVYNRAATPACTRFPRHHDHQAGLLRGLQCLALPDRGWIDTTKLGFFLVRVTGWCDIGPSHPDQRGDPSQPPDRRRGS